MNVRLLLVVSGIHLLLPEQMTSITTLTTVICSLIVTHMLSDGLSFLALRARMTCWSQ